MDYRYGSRTYTIRDGLPGHGLSLLSVRGHSLPAMTDLLAVPGQNLAEAEGEVRGPDPCATSSVRFHVAKGESNGLRVLKSASMVPTSEDN